VSAQHGDFVSEHQDLGVLGGVRLGEQRQPAQHADEHQVDESEGHNERSCGVGCGPWPQGQPVAKALIRRLDTVLGTHSRQAREHRRPFPAGAIDRCAIAAEGASTPS
jgi:hypothetical protein